MIDFETPSSCWFLLYEQLAPTPPTQTYVYFVFSPAFRQLPSAQQAAAGVDQQLHADNVCDPQGDEPEAVADLLRRGGYLPGKIRGKFQLQVDQGRREGAQREEERERIRGRFVCF